MFLGLSHTHSRCISTARSLVARNALLRVPFSDAFLLSYVRATVGPLARWPLHFSFLPCARSAEVVAFEIMHTYFPPASLPLSLFLSFSFLPLALFFVTFDAIGCKEMRKKGWAERKKQFELV